MRKLRLLSFSAVIAGLVLGMSALALSGTDARAQGSTPEETVAEAVEAWNDGDAEAFIAAFAPGGLEAVVGIEPTVEAVEADMEETGPIASYEVSDLKLEHNVFTAIVDIQFEAGFGLYEMWEFVKSADGWLISGSTPASQPIPPGVPTVDLTLQEYAFVYNEAAIQAADGNFAFSVTNAGEEEHEVLLLSIDSDKSLLQLLEESDPESEDLPEGLGFVTFGGFYAPGDEGTVVLPEPLSSGRYGMVCFVSSPEGIPHAFLGMVSEFTIGSGPVDGPSGGGGITPPSTGDGGLLDGATGSTTWAILGLAAVLLLGGAVGLTFSREKTGA